jgi:glutathione S-transferase
MTPLSTQPALQSFAVACATLVVLLFALSALTALRRRALQQVINPEDTGLNPGSVAVEVEPPALLRVKRAHQNLLENSVPFLAIGALYTQTAPSPGWALGLFGTFVAMRFVHAGCYLAGLQPWRTLAFIVGSLVNLALAGFVLRAALG